MKKRLNLNKQEKEVLSSIIYLLHRSGIYTVNMHTDNVNLISKDQIDSVANIPSCQVNEIICDLIKKGILITPDEVPEVCDINNQWLKEYFDDTIELLTQINQTYTKTILVLDNYYIDVYDATISNNPIQGH